MWKVMVLYNAGQPDRDDPLHQVALAWINNWHHSRCMEVERIFPGDRIAAVKGPLGMPWMDDRRILEYTTGHDFTSKLCMMFFERQHLYLDLNTCCFVCVGRVALSHGHFPAAPVRRWRMRDRLQTISLCTRTGLRKVMISQSPDRPWGIISGSWCVLVSLVSARDGLHILRGIRTLERIHLYKLARKAMRPFAFVCSKFCDLTSIGTVRNVLGGFLRSGYSTHRHSRNAKRAKLR